VLKPGISTRTSPRGRKIIVHRRGLAASLKALRRDNTLVMWTLNRLRRDLRHLVSLIDDLTKRNIGLKVLAGEGASIDTSAANGRLVFGIFAAFAEFERALIVEPTKAGLATARARPEWRSSVQDDAGKTPPCSSCEGKTGNQGGRSLRRTWDHSASVLSACRSEG
jgi:DNA invertase Pin-like site-specific DNA recombinase